MTAHPPYTTDKNRSAIGWKAALAAVSGYILLSLLITWPMVLHFSTKIPGVGGDDLMFVWNYWWVKHAVMDLKTNPFYTDYMFYPHKTALFMHTYAFTNGVLSVPLQYIMPLPAVYNVITLLSFTLSGLGAYLLAFKFAGNRKAAFISGFIFAAYVSAYMLYANIYSAQWVPLYLYFLLSAFDAEEGRPWLRHSILAGVLLVASFFSDYYHFIGAFFFTLIVLLFYLVSKKQSPAMLLKRFSPVILIALPFILPVVIVLIKQSGMYGFQGSLAKSLGTEKNVADLAGLFSPSPSNPITGRLSFTGLLTGMTPMDKSCYLGVTAVFFMAFALLKRRLDMKMAMWLAAAVFFLALAIGPYPHFLGKQLPVPMPFKLFALSSFFAQLRAPVRLAIYAMLAISILAAAGMAMAFEKKAFLFPIVLVLALVEYTAFKPLYDCSAPAIYKQIAADKNAQTVLEVPIFDHDGLEWMGDPFSYSLYYQTIHGKRLLSGYLARVPQPVFWSYFNLPVYRTLLMLPIRSFSGPDLNRMMAADKAMAPYFLDLFGLDYVIVHRRPPVEKPLDLKTGFAEQYLKQVLPMDLIYADQSIAVYKTRHALTGPLTVQAATPLSVLYLYKNWINGQSDGGRGFAWATGDKSILLAKMDPASDYELDMEIKPYEDITDKRIEIGINGKRLAEINPAGGWAEYKVEIPGRLAAKGLNRIYFRPAQTAPTALNMGGVWPRFALGLPKLPFATDWEQDNSRFKDPKISFALSRFTIRKKP